MIRLPPLFEAAVHAELASLRISRQQQTAALRELFELFTSERSQLGRQSYLDQPRLRAAYLGYHLPLNVARAAYVLTQVDGRTERLADLRTVIDLGGGPGSAAWASLGQRVPPAGNLRPLNITVFDQSSGALKLGEKLWQSNRQNIPRSEMSFVKHSLPSLPRWTGPALVWLAMVLNELMRNRRFDLSRFVASLTKRCEPGSVLIVTEPALRQPGRDLLSFHDRAVETGGWEVIAPCTHQLTCPLLTLAGKSWCHFRFDWEVPQSVLDLAQPLTLECRTPSVAYLALLRIGEGERAAARQTDEARVIGDPMPLKTGEKGVYLCREGRRELLSPVPSGTRRGDVIRSGSRRKSGGKHR